ncbi:MAG: nucleoid-associated protein YgaU [Planctomycetota bacterium]|jgi:nucleoid-associated protein YgaU
MAETRVAPLGFAGQSAATRLSRPESYTVRAGDSAARIAMSVYGSASMAEAILKENGLQDSNFLRVGQVLTLPSVR